MSGLAAYTRWTDEPGAATVVADMLEAQAHRGPDGRGVRSESGFAVGQLRLATVEADDTQPWMDPTRRVMVVADARIDNRDDLVRALALDRGRDRRDAELIGRAYLTWGPECPARLLGDFAFVVWDAGRREAFCARDHFGVRPLHYYAGTAGFAAASEIKGVLRAPGVPRQLNEPRIADYLLSMLDDTASTFYRDILRLPPAHAMTVTPGGVRRWKYWALDPEREIRYRTDAEYAEAFREIFREAVGCRLQAAGPVGAMLSGGLDSSAIVCTAAALLAGSSRKVRTYSLVFDPARGCDERSYIEAVVATAGTSPTYIPAASLSPLSDWSRQHALHDEPGAANLFLHEALHARAAADGVRVLLDGFDGDTVVSHGIAHLGELGRRGRWLRLAREARALSRQHHVSPWTIVARHGVRPMVPRPVRRQLGRLRRRREPVVRQSFLSEIDWPSRARPFDAFGRASESARREHHARLVSGLVPNALEAADRIAAVHGTEARYPFFDRRLAEFCLALPGSQKLRQGWTRWVMRQALDGILPRVVQWRPGKSDISTHFTAAAAPLRDSDEARERTRRRLDRYARVDDLWRAWRECAHDDAGGCATDVWRTSVLAHWLDWFDRPSADRP